MMKAAPLGASNAGSTPRIKRGVKRSLRQSDEASRSNKVPEPFKSCLRFIDPERLFNDALNRRLLRIRTLRPKLACAALNKDDATGLLGAILGGFGHRLARWLGILRRIYFRGTMKNGIGVFTDVSISTSRSSPVQAESNTGTARHGRSDF
jgi:hypothetical protein